MADKIQQDLTTFPLEMLGDLVGSCRPFCLINKNIYEITDGQKRHEGNVSSFVISKNLTLLGICKYSDDQILGVLNVCDSSHSYPCRVSKLQGMDL